MGRIESTDPGPQYRLLSSLQPHRRDLPAESRLDPNASTEIGRLFILSQISREQHIAGERWAYTVAAYMATLAAPQGMGTSGRGNACQISTGTCQATPDNPHPECQCEKRRQTYLSARTRLFGNGAKVARIIDDVVIWGEPCHAVHLPALRQGLADLALHFGVA